MVEKKAERNVMLNASDANAPRYIQIGLPSEDVNVYENGLPVVYSSYIHPLSAHWRSDGSLAEVGLMNPGISHSYRKHRLFSKQFQRLRQ